ncbi:glycoside hydrolase family 79 protein [Gymnopilus junonius]|uniref:Glycoside hydrolase family 79 protein n=1 Tax=Gymnopilus junonius TaxID=109634 RepID=A0A9P5NMX0_GYMJU|nr:glycoside hydrolase family 79 protein [Gymnopilus junonius]
MPLITVPRLGIGTGAHKSFRISFPLSFLLLVTLAFLQTCSASITVYHPKDQTVLSADPAAPTGTNSPGSGNYTGPAAFNPTTLIAPSPPGLDALPTSFGIALSNTPPPGASIMHSGSFFGFSIEMSVVNQVLGTNASVLQVPFLNLMANLQQRAGGVVVRVGGNTQETAALVSNTPNGKMIEKDYGAASNPTDTPPLVFTDQLLYLLANISSLVNVHWHLGVPFNDTSNFRLAIAEQGQAILGNYLIGLQVGNEPDLYGTHGHRPSGYSPSDYVGEFGKLVSAMAADSSIHNQNILIGPSVNTGPWTPEMVWDTGFINNYTSNLAYLSVEHYPSDNCFAQFGIGTPRDPQTMFTHYLNHTAPQALISPYLNSTAYVQTQGKKLLMFETNTASCGGFNGVSDSFGAALWGLDYGMQLAHSNFSGGLFHVGGQNVFYNPFTPPPTNQSTFRRWTIGPIYYSALVMAEALGPGNNTQVVDLQGNTNNIYSPAYAIYDNSTLVRVMLFNYVTDSTGASDLTVALTLTGGQMPASVQVKYLQASSVAQKGNYTWAGQTFGPIFGSDGRLTGTEQIQTILCSSVTGTSTCNIHVPAPGVALVFLSPSYMTETAGGSSKTFSTTVQTRMRNTASVDPEVLATSNGHTGMDGYGELGSTSEGSVTGGAAGVRVGRSRMGMAVAAVGGAVVGGLVVFFGSVMW